jgi:hypothetical protein
VFVALILLVILILLTPAIVFVDGTTIYGVVALVASAALGIVSINVRPGEAAHLLKVLRPALLLLAIPAVLIVIQLLPLPLLMSHPIWESATQALNTWPLGHITIDLGFTLIGLIQYLGAVAILVTAAAVAIDRDRAEWLLYSLTGTTTFLATVLIAHALVGLFPLAGSDPMVALRSASALGTGFAAAVVIRSVERYETRRNTAEMTRTKFVWTLIGGLAALAVCWLALLIAAPRALVFAAGCGLATVALAVFIRRFALGAMAAATLAASTLMAAIALATGLPDAGGSPTLRFAAEGSSSAASSAERMMSDNPLGTGIGTFRALLPIYQSIDDAAGSDSAPTTAAQVAVEMGRSAPWILAVMALVAAGMLLRGAMSRGRDSFYSIAAAGTIVTLVLGAFVDASLRGTAVLILTTSFLGLGFAQSASRTAS